MRQHLRRIRTSIFRVPTLAVIALGLAAVFAAVDAVPGVTATGHAGPATVTVTPTSGLTDGQAITIHAEVPAGTELFEVRAHICTPGTGAVLFPGDVYDFGYQSAYCSKAKPGNGDNETAHAFPRGTTAGDLTFKAGVGTMSWDDEDPTTPAHHDVTCGPGSNCELVVQLQITDTSVYYATPLCYGAGCPADPSAPPTTAAPASAGGSAGGKPSAAAAAGGAAAGSAGNTAAHGGTAAAGANTPKASGSSDSASASASPANTDGASTIATAVFGSPVIHRAVRIFTAGVAGIAGGVLIMLIILRARKQMTGVTA
jgi:hypothetical protein